MKVNITPDSGNKKKMFSFLKKIRQNYRKVHIYNTLIGPARKSDINALAIAACILCSWSLIHLYWHRYRQAKLYIKDIFLHVVINTLQLKYLKT